MPPYSKFLDPRLQWVIELYVYMCDTVTQIITIAQPKLLVLLSGILYLSQF